MADRFDLLLAALQRERAKVPAQRESRATDRVLDNAIASVSRAAALAHEGRYRDSHTAISGVVAIAVDSWSWVSPITVELAGLANTVNRLAETKYAAEWAGAGVDASALRASAIDHLAPPAPEKRPLLRAAWRAVAVLAAAVAWTAIVVLLYRRGTIAVAGAYVAPAVATAIIVVPMLWLVGQARRRRGQLTDQLRALAGHLDGELRMPPGLRPSGATDESLRQARAQVDAAVRSIVTEAKADGVDDIKRLASNASAWSRRSPSTRAIRRLDRNARRLARSVRISDHLGHVRARQGQPEDPREVHWWDRWLIRFPLYSLLAGMGAYGLHQSGWVAPREAVGVLAVGVLLIGAVLLFQHRRTARLRKSRVG